MFSFSTKARRFSIAGTALAAALLTLSCSKLGDPVLEPAPPPPDSTSPVPTLSARADTTIREGELLEIRFAATDPRSLGLVYVVEGEGSFVGADWSWRPSFAQHGTYPVRVITHVQGHPEWADTLTFSVTVLDEAEPGPRFDFIRDTTILEDQLLSLAFSATDPRGVGLVYSMTGPAGATLTGTTFAWKPAFTQAGTHDVIFRVADKGVPIRRDTLRVRVTVLNVDRPPVLQALADTSIDTSQTLHLTLSAVDPDGDIVIYSAPGRPLGSLLSGASFQWKPRPTQLGENTLRFVAAAGTLSDTVTVTVTVRAKPVLPVDTVAPPVFVPDPVAYWSFDNATASAAPSTPGGRPIALAGGVTLASGVSGTALGFNGTAAQYGESQAAFPDMTEQTLAAWVYVDSLDRTTITLIQESDNASGRDNELSIERSTGSTTWKFMYRTRDDDGRHFSNGTVSAKKWHYLAGTATRDTVRLYINGELDKTLTTPAPFNLSGNHYRIQLARKYDSRTVYPYNLRGRLDEIKLFDKALTPAQIKAEWNRHKTAAGY